MPSGVPPGQFGFPRGVGFLHARAEILGQRIDGLPFTAAQLLKVDHGGALADVGDDAVCGGLARIRPVILGLVLVERAVDVVERLLGMFGHIYTFGLTNLVACFGQRVPGVVAGDFLHFGVLHLLDGDAGLLGEHVAAQLHGLGLAALCGDRLWEVLEFPGVDGKPRYVSAWVWEQGDSRLLCVGKDGRCPKADAPREYVTRAEVEAALAGEAMPVIEAPVPVAIPTPVAPEAVSAPQTAEECAEAAPMLPDTPEAPAIDATPASCQPEPETLTIWQRGARLGLTQGDEESNGEFMLRVEALEAALPAQAVAGKRTPAHERAIRRAWAERKARRMAEAERDKVMAAYNASGDARRALRKERDDWEGRAMRMAGKRRRAVVQARNAKHTARHFLHESLANYDRRINAEHEARVALAAREDLKRMHEAAERRAAAAEAENAQLWAEIEALTAPVAALAA